ncbi:MAG TPA: preprotein translocase subunit SecE [Candidatus Paceibacterota bacterium]
MITKLKLFLQESRQEFKRINWPTRKETMRMVFIVVTLSVMVSIFLGLWDYIFIYLLELVV